MRSPERIDGWKAIGAHFGRDRTTAMRWAQTRGLPVRRIPGGKVSTVYALRSELDDWSEHNADKLDVIDDDAGIAPQSVQKRDWKRRAFIVVPVLAVAMAVGVGSFLASRKPASTSAQTVSMNVPADPALAELYIQARDDWALRTPTGLARAIASLEQVTRKDPGFAPAFAALADSYLLASEFGFISDEDGFPKADLAARTSLRLDPGLAAGQRALGFVQYWWDGDPVAAGKSFRRALQLAPNSAQTHFWYGNILSDNGNHAAAWRELSQARLLEPGSVAIQTDLAWAQWRAGRQREAKSALMAIIGAQPYYSAAYDCLASVKLSEGDHAGFVADFAQYARLRQEPVLIARAAQQARALEEGREALERLMLAGALDRADQEIGRSLAGAAFIASLAGNRAALIEILQRADKSGEVWGSSGETSRIRQRWTKDVEVLHLLARRAPPGVE